MRIRPPSAPDLLAQARQRRHNGDLAAAISAAEQAVDLAINEADVVSLAHSFVDLARSFIVLRSPVPAQQALRMVPESVLSNEPGLKAVSELVKGLAMRHHAHCRWKQGLDPSPLIEQARHHFRTGAALAKDCQMAREHQACAINLLYTEGLAVAVKQQSESLNLELLLQILVSGDAYANSSYQSDRNLTVPMTMIADLALGAHLQVSDVMAKASGTEQAACGRILQAKGSSWPRLLRWAAASPSASLIERARAMVLGAKYLCADRVSRLDTASIFEYQTYLSFFHSQISKQWQLRGRWRLPSKMHWQLPVEDTTLGSIELSLRSLRQC